MATVRSTDIRTMNQVDIFEFANIKKMITRHSHGDDANGNNPYTILSLRAKNHKDRLSATARTSSSIKKTDVFMREPYTITKIMRQLKTVPTVQVVNVVKNSKYEPRYSAISATVTKLPLRFEKS